MKFLVIGSKGFIGSHCVNYFSLKNDVWGCDVVMDYNASHYISIDAVDSDFKEIFQRQDFDVCINCSGAANVSFSLQKPYNDYRLNTLNVYKLLDAIRIYCPDCKFINMSSAAIYGNPENLPIKETMASEPVSPYGYHKMMSELICEEYTRFWGIKTCNLRIFSAYGPGLKKQLFWDLYQKLMKDKTPALWGTGKESRDFIYIDDIIRIIELAIDNSTFNAECVNVANGSQTEIREIVRIMSDVMSSEKTVIFNQKERKGDPINWEADITVIREWGYKQTVKLRDGIEKYVLWAKENI